MPRLTHELVKKSSLTPTQLETMLLSRRVKGGEISVKQAGKMKASHTVKPGSYYRILDQARVNLREATYSLLIAVRLHTVNMEDMSRLVQTVREAPEEMSDESLEQFATVVDQLVHRLVTL